MIHDLTNQRFGRLFVMYRYTKLISQKKRTYYHCKCDCGKEIEVRQDHLLDGHISSCGCLQLERTTKQLLNTHIGCWTIVEQVPAPEFETRTGSWWKLKCDKCGEEKILKGIHITAERVGFCSSEKQSRGEYKIAELLSNANIIFKREKTFSNCRSTVGYLFRFDFYLPQYNILIEYNGEQHYKYCEFFQDSYANFLKRQKTDEYKKRMGNKKWL